MQLGIGEIVYSYSLREHDFIYFVTLERGKVVLMTMDKNLNAISQDLVLNSSKLISADELNFFKPVKSEEGLTFKGTAVNGDELVCFNFNNQDFTVNYSTSDISRKVELSYSLFEAMTDIEVKQGIQNLSSFYFVGYCVEGGYSSPCVGILDIETQKLDKLYFLYSDKGIIDLNTLSLDFENKRILVGGRLSTDEGETFKYVESFLH